MHRKRKNSIYLFLTKSYYYYQFDRNPIVLKIKFKEQNNHSYLSSFPTTTNNSHLPVRLIPSVRQTIPKKKGKKKKNPRSPRIHPQTCHIKSFTTPTVTIQPPSLPPPTSLIQHGQRHNFSSRYRRAWPIAIRPVRDRKNPRYPIETKTQFQPSSRPRFISHLFSII